MIQALPFHHKAGSITPSSDDHVAVSVEFPHQTLERGLLTPAVSHQPDSPLPVNL